MHCLSVCRKSVQKPQTGLIVEIRTLEYSNGDKFEVHST